jgi:hypothetical protein
VVTPLPGGRIRHPPFDTTAHPAADACTVSSEGRRELELRRCLVLIALFAGLWIRRNRK